MTTGTYFDLLKSRGFQAFLWTQFLGAFNDNVFKIVISLFAVHAATSASGASGNLSLVGAVFILPFLLFSGYAGHLADVFNKRTVLIITKSFEIVAMGLGFFALVSGRFDFLLGVLFLMALHSTCFSPAKYGILPEMLPEKDLSRANGLLEMSTFLAIILGTSVGSFMIVSWRHHPHVIGAVLILVAIVGTVTSFGIPRVPSSGARKPFRLNPWAEIVQGLRRLYQTKALWLTVLGISYFWFLGALLQMDIILFGKELMHLDDLRIGILGTFLAVGIGVGSLLAGYLSGDKVELGLVPLGSIGMALVALWLALSAHTYYSVAAALCLLGLAGGLFIVPLNALLQQRSGTNVRGQLIATNNFLNTVGILLASGMLWLLRDGLHAQADQIVLIVGLLTLVATVYILTLLPDFLIRFTLWMITHSIYRIRVVGQEHVPFRGPALLVCNHMSHVDGLLIGASVQRFVRFMIYRPIYEARALNWLFRLMNAIPVSPRRRDVMGSVERARADLRQGHVVCIFAEGAISRTGNLLPFKRGFEKIVEDLDVPVIPMHLDRLWGSIFSFTQRRFFWKWPKRLPYPVTVSFGVPLPSTVKAAAVRQAVLELGSEAAALRRTSRDLLSLRFITTAKHHWSQVCMADSTGASLTYGRALASSIALSRWIRRRSANDAMIGVMLPSSVAGALANIAVLLAGKVPVNLNFMAGREALAYAIDQCEIRTILTSRVFLSKLKIPQTPDMLCFEDVTREMTGIEKALAALTALLPARVLCALYRDRGHTSEALATVIFSSGSTGVPKGVMLSHQNILSNVEALTQIFEVTAADRIMGVLPFFHSFGLTATLWFPLVSGFGASYHPNPLDAKTIGEMVATHKATILISTPTFYAAYLRKCSVEEFASLRLAVTGAEKLRDALATAFKDKYGLDLLEGYGCTEMGPVVSVNLPDVVDGSETQTGRKRGSVGHPLPGVAVKVVDPNTGDAMPVDTEGLLLAKGPNRMLGYLNEPEKTSEVFRNGWYVTGDIAALDDDGFIRITDRLSRFSKIGGEMVPHLKIEEAINQILGDQAVVVTSVPDEQKGERLIALYTVKHVTPEELWSTVSHTDLPKLWIPKRESFYYIEAIPALGTGKVDLRQVKLIALEKAKNEAFAE
jgi:acyl-[acyl-carrier-protein]-phospholipid O-acyltransferase/long-chain-fatty-acid--[acyl-carrier-protein] ligase